MKKVTTITPCYNGVKYLNQCWESIKNQTIGVENMECIFVDDCSTDGTWEILREIEGEYPENVIVIQLPENRRQGGARNEALQYASGEYLQFLDQDDWLEETALEELYTLAKEKDMDIIQFDYVHPTGKDPADTFCKQEQFFDLSDVLERKEMLSSGVMVCSHHNHFYKRSLWEETGSFFPEHMVYEEPLFDYPMYFNAKKILISTKQLYNMRSHAESSTETLLASHLEDHPKVQKMLLEFLKTMPGVMETYGEEIEFYFLWSYYVETVINAGCGGTLSLECFLAMQKEVKSSFPDYMENKYINELGPNILRVLQTVNKKVSTKEEMDLLTQNLADEYYGG